MGSRLRRCRGQSILEYLVIATVIVGAILLVVNGAVKTNINNLYQRAADKTSQAAQKLQNPLGE